MEDLGLAGCPIFGEAEAGDPVCCPSPGQLASSRAMGCCWEKDAEPLGASLCLHVLLLGTQIPAPSSGTFSLSISMTTLSAATSPPPLFKLGQQCLGFCLLFLLLTLSPKAAPRPGVLGVPRPHGVCMGRGWWHLGDPAEMPCPPAHSHPGSLGDTSEEGRDAASPRCHHPLGFSSRNEFARLPLGSLAPVRDDDATPSRLPYAFLDYISVKEIF